MTTLCQPCEPLGKVLVKKWSRVSRGFYIKSGEQVDLKIGEMPKQSTIEKYELKNSEIKECMEEVYFANLVRKSFIREVNIGIVCVIK